MLSPNYVFLAYDNCRCDLVKKPVINEVVVYNIEHDSFVDDAPPFGSCGWTVLLLFRSGPHTHSLNGGHHIRAIEPGIGSSKIK